MAFCVNCGSPVQDQFCTKCGARVGSAATPRVQPQAPAPSSPPVYQPPVTSAGAPPPAKKRGPLIWILGGCLGLVVIAVILVIAGGYFVVNKVKQAGFDPVLMQKNPGLAVAKMMAAMNADIEVLGVDEAHGIIKVRDKKNGKTLTINLEDAKKGKIVFLDENNQKVEIQAQGEGNKASLEVRGPEGSMRMGAGVVQLPDWLPAYPGAEGTGTFGINSKEGNAASCAFKTNDSVEKVASFYETSLKNAGFEVERTVAQASGQGSLIILAAKDNSSQRTAQVMATGTAEGTTVNLTFETKK